MEVNRHGENLLYREAVLLLRHSRYASFSAFFLLSSRLRRRKGEVPSCTSFHSRLGGSVLHRRLHAESIPLPVSSIYRDRPAGDALTIIKTSLSVLAVSRAAQQGMLQ